MTTKQALRLINILIKVLGALLGELEESKALRQSYDELREFRNEIEDSEFKRPGKTSCS